MVTVKKLVYAQESGLEVDSFVGLLTESGLGLRRPVDDRERMRRMLVEADLIVTARLDGELAGVARALTDFSFCCYLAELAVAERFKGHGIGQGLIAEVRRLAGPESMCLLLAAPEAEGFYDHIGMPRTGNAFLYPRAR